QVFGVFLCLALPMQIRLQNEVGDGRRCHYDTLTHTVETHHSRIWSTVLSSLRLACTNCPLPGHVPPVHRLGGHEYAAKSLENVASSAIGFLREGRCSRAV